MGKKIGTRRLGKEPIRAGCVDGGVGQITFTTEDTQRSSETLPTPQEEHRIDPRRYHFHTAVPHNAKASTQDQWIRLLGTLSAEPLGSRADPQQGNLESRTTYDTVTEPICEQFMNKGTYLFAMYFTRKDTLRLLLFSRTWKFLVVTEIK